MCLLLFLRKKQRLTRVLCRRHTSNGATSGETSFTFSGQDNTWHLASHGGFEWHMAQGEDGGHWHMAWNEEMSNDMWRLLKVAPHWHLADKWEERENDKWRQSRGQGSYIFGFFKIQVFQKKSLCDTTSVWVPHCFFIEIKTRQQPLFEFS